MGQSPRGAVLGILPRRRNSGTTLGAKSGGRHMEERFMASMRKDKDNQGGANAELGPLPVWDLSDLYPAPDSPELERDIERTEREAQAFAQRYQGKLAALAGAALGAAIA